MKRPPLKVLLSLLSACVAPGGGAMDAGGDAGRAADTDGASGEDVLCNGADEIRLALRAELDAMPAGSFTRPFGEWFLFVDGHCRYFASSGFMHGVHSGTLGATQARELAEAVGWLSWAAWAELPHQGTCPDGATFVFQRPGASTRCSCGCNLGDTPVEQTEASKEVYGWARMLAEQGELLDAGVSALARAADSPTGGELAWPLARPVAAIDGLVHAPGMSSDAGVRFDDADEVARLRALRAQALQGDARIRFVPISSEGIIYQLYVRDELPDEVSAAVQALVD